MFFECDCGQEAIHIERDLELFDENKRDACLLNFSIYHLGTENHKPTLKEKLRHCWHILRTGKNYSDQIILSEGTARQLGKCILDLVSEKSISEASNIYECGHCGFRGNCYGIPTDVGLSASYCPQCQKNDKLELVVGEGNTN